MKKIQRLRVKDLNGSFGESIPFGAKAENIDLPNGSTLDKSGVFKEDLVDNLNSTATDKALTANQGKVLNDTIIQKEAILNDTIKNNTDALRKELQDGDQALSDRLDTTNQNLENAKTTINQIRQDIGETLIKIQHDEPAAVPGKKVIWIKI